MKNNESRLFRHVWPPHLQHASLAVIGCIQPIMAINPSSEMQCRWAVRVIKGTAFFSRGGVEDTRLEANAKAEDTKKFRGQGQEQTILRPRTKDTDPSVLQTKKVPQNFFFRRSQKKGLQNFFQAKKVFKNFFSGDFYLRKPKKVFADFRKVSGVFQQNFNGSRNSAVLEPRTGQFLRT